MAKKAKQGTYRVWIEQVNQTCIEVSAKDASEAADKAYRKWRREAGHSRVSYVEKQDTPHNYGETKMITLEESTELAIRHGFSGYGEQNGFYQIPVAAFHDRLNRLCNQVRDFALDDAEDMCEKRACCINADCRPAVAIRQAGKDILGIKNEGNAENWNEGYVSQGSRRKRT